ncbi:hypothetical protein ACHAPT_011906 [Fusarium lateritium]
MLQISTLLALFPAVFRAKLPSTSNYLSKCQKAYDAAYTFNASGWVVDDLADDPFWQAPTNLTNAAPGDLLKWETLGAEGVGANWTIPGGTSLSRLVYVTQDIDGDPLPATAFVLLPFAQPKSGGKLRTILWAHGTAVIAPDYTGLGIKIPQGFMYEAGWSHAADAAYSLAAARKVIGKWLSDEWVAIGQSEGGLTAWRLNERLATPGSKTLKKAGNLIGVVSIAPALRPIDLLESFYDEPSLFGITALLSSYIMRSISGLYSDFRLERYLTQVGLELARYVGENGCSLSGLSVFAGLTKDSFFKNVDWKRDPAVVDWRKKYNGEGRTSKIAAPLLVVQGDADLAVPAAFTKEDLERTRAANPRSSIRYYEYKALDHDLVTGNTQRDYLAWVKDRFDGVKANPGFLTSTISNLTGTFYPTMRVYNGKAYGEPGV